MISKLKPAASNVSSCTVDTGRFYPANIPSWNRTEFFTVGSISNFASRSECNQLLDAFQELHILHANTRLLVIGDGPELAEFQIAISKHGLTNWVTLTGAVKRNEVPALMRRMNAVVQIIGDDQHTYYQRRVTKYMATGLPIVTTDKNGIIRHNVTGLVVNDASASAVAAALACLRQAPALAERLGNTARDFILAQESGSQFDASPASMTDSTAAYSQACGLTGVRLGAH